jgi:hypothetical protein
MQKSTAQIILRAFPAKQRWSVLQGRLVAEQCDWWVLPARSGIGAGRRLQDNGMFRTEQTGQRQVLFAERSQAGRVMCEHAVRNRKRTDGFEQCMLRGRSNLHRQERRSDLLPVASGRWSMHARQRHTGAAAMFTGIDRSELLRGRI